MDLKLRGLNVIINGATRGLGRAIAERLAAEGCNVGICARNAEEVEKAVAELSRHGTRITGAAIDVIGDGTGYEAWITKTGNELGGLDIVISNVGGTTQGADVEAFRQNFEGTVIVAVRSVDTAMPFLEKSRHPSILFIGSIAAHEDFLGVSAFNATKAVLPTYANSLSRALGPKGIRVNLITPGTIFVEGGSWDKIKSYMPDIYDMAMRENPMGRLGKAEEVADSVAFMVSPLASFVSGANLVVDGGYTRRVHF